jgi:hypothetical protein
MIGTAPYLLVSLIVGLAAYFFLFRASARRAEDSLATCSDCGGTVQEGVPECRHCGATFTKPRRRKPRRKAKRSTSHSGSSSPRQD